MATINKIIMIGLMLTIVSCSSQSFSEIVVYDEEISQFQYPFEVKTFVLNSQQQSLNMRYMDIGTANKKAVVLLHGKNFSGFYWQKIASELLAKGFRVIIPDQIGFGKSTKPENYHYSFYQFGKNTQELLKKLNVSQYTVVGHSMGGMLAVNMAYLFPKSVRKLVLINPIGLETYLDYVKFKDTNFFYKIESNKTVDKIRNYQKKNYYDGKWSDDYEKLLLPFKGLLAGQAWPRVAWNNALTYTPIFSEDIVSKMPKLKLETHIIIGIRDRTGPGRNWKREGVTYKLGQYQKLGKLTKKRIKGSKLYELKGLGHMPQFENYKMFSKVFYQIFD